VLELRGRLLTSREALRPSEPHHSPNKVTPSYYTKNVSFASEISIMWCVCVDLHHEGPFIEAEGSLYRLNQVSLEEMDGRAAIDVAGRRLLLGSTDF
jgi:hypothetical protein